MTLLSEGVPFTWLLAQVQESTWHIFKGLQFYEWIFLMFLGLQQILEVSVSCHRGANSQRLLTAKICFTGSQHRSAPRQPVKPFIIFTLYDCAVPLAPYCQSRCTYKWTRVLFPRMGTCAIALPSEKCCTTAAEIWTPLLSATWVYLTACLLY